MLHTYENFNKYNNNDYELNENLIGFFRKMFGKLFKKGIELIKNEKANSILKNTKDKIEPLYEEYFKLKYKDYLNKEENKGQDKSQDKDQGQDQGQDQKTSEKVEVKILNSFLLEKKEKDIKDPKLKSLKDEIDVKEKDFKNKIKKLKLEDVEKEFFYNQLDKIRTEKQSKVLNSASENKNLNPKEQKELKDIIKKQKNNLKKIKDTIKDNLKKLIKKKENLTPGKQYVYNKDKKVIAIDDTFVITIADKKNDDWKNRNMDSDKNYDENKIFKPTKEKLESIKNSDNYIEFDVKEFKQKIKKNSSKIEELKTLEFKPEIELDNKGKPIKK